MHGYAGTSTRDVAAAARTHQPQINYHFGSKIGLWKAVIEELFELLDHYLADIPDGAPERVLAETIRRFVRFAAAHPELNRLIVHESTVASERLDWLVEEHIAPRYAILSVLCERLDATQVPTSDPLLFYYCFVGAASLLAVNSLEAERLIGADPLAGRVEAHADAVVRMMLGPTAT